ncbi:hypothetical protein TRFO_32949 [Tritrichomonas foetus]|uniref:Uncharacterized protein n=1 Tax=Tritrichomonas foetus TaxID=1144522 RepID=A0A1J4JMR4_9EUKA|nr:hypothetical protein TRFO_32949 [Tritrichomonas foetus]|eukprot:OHT00407.1 hypothetical protein TRFO_32949 [Tritrichomonas foetus]
MRKVILVKYFSLIIDHESSPISISEFSRERMIKVKKSQRRLIIYILFSLVSLLFPFTIYSWCDFQSKCHFYLNTHFLDRNALYIAARTWLGSIFVKMGIFKITMISMPNHKVDKLFYHIHSNCSAKYNGKLNLPCIDDELYHHFLNRSPKLNWLYISNVMNHVNFKNLYKYINMLETFSDPKKHIIFKTHLSNDHVSDLTGFLVSRAFVQFVIDSNISIKNVSFISEGGFAHTAHTHILTAIFNNSKYYDELFMTDKICGNCDITPLGKCPNNQNLFRAADFITTGMRVFPKLYQEYTRKMNSFSSIINLYFNENKTFHICRNTNNLPYKKLEKETIKQNTPLLDINTLHKQNIHKNIFNKVNENRGYIPKFRNLLNSNYEIKNYVHSNSTKVIIFVHSVISEVEHVNEFFGKFLKLDLFKNRIFQLFFVYPKLEQEIEINTTFSYIITPCSPKRDGPESLSCRNDFANRAIYEYYSNADWIVRLTDDSHFVPNKFMEYIQKLEEFINPSKHILFKAWITTYFKNIEYLCGGGGWLKTKAWNNYMIEHNISLMEFARFSHEMQDDTAMSHVVWSIYNSSKQYVDPFISDFHCVECESVYKGKNIKSLSTCPSNVELTNFSDIFLSHLIRSKANLYVLENRNSFGNDLAIYSIPDKFIYHLCIPKQEQKMNNLQTYNFKKVTPIFSEFDNSKLLRPDDYMNYYFATRKVF